MKRLNQTGSHILAFALVALVVGVTVFAGYKVYQNQKTTTDTGDTGQTQTATVPKTIKNTADLNSVGKVLDDSSAQLDSNLNDSALNNNLNDLL